MTSKGKREEPSGKASVPKPAFLKQQIGQKGQENRHVSESTLSHAETV